MSHRVIDGLKWAQLDEVGPGFGRSRPRGRKAAGLRYERELAKALPSAKHGQWIRFADRHGLGFAQPDFLIELRDVVVVLETKYTWVAEGHSQIELLYRPLVETIWRKPVIGIVVAKVLTPDCRQLAVWRSLDEALNAGLGGERSGVWHWIGSGPLFSPSVPKGLTPESLGL